MSKFILRSFALSVVCAAVAFGQGTMAQIAFGGSWQTTFTLVNLNSTATATITLSFFADDGSPLIAPVQGFANTSAYTFAIPANGTQNIVLTNSSPTTQGWANVSVSSGGPIRGQATFRFLVPTGNGTLSEAVVPLSVPGVPGCILPFPQIDPVILIPFDNTGGYVTSVAIANITTGPQSPVIEFIDQSGKVVLATDTLFLTGNQHKAFVSRDAYAAVAGQKGVLRIHASTSNVTVLGLSTNPTGAVATIIPITQ